MAKITDPFAAYNIPPRPVPNIPVPPQAFRPGTTSPLDQTARDARSLGVSIESAQEQRRAEQIPAGVANGDHAPRFGDRVAPSPFPARTAVPVDPNPAPKAGGSKS
jgi:hypothetical protein